MMKHFKTARMMALAMSGAVLMQTTGCTFTALDFIQTILLGVTAAGAVVLIDNI